MPSIGEDEEQLVLSHIACRIVKYYNYFEKQFGSLKEMKANIHTRTCTKTSIHFYFQ